MEAQRGGGGGGEAAALLQKTRNKRWQEEHHRDRQYMHRLGIASIRIGANGIVWLLNSSARVSLTEKDAKKEKDEEDEGEAGADDDTTRGGVAAKAYRKMTAAEDKEVQAVQTPEGRRELALNALVQLESFCLAVGHCYDILVEVIEQSLDVAVVLEQRKEEQEREKARQDLELHLMVAEDDWLDREERDDHDDGDCDDDDDDTEERKRGEGDASTTLIKLGGEVDAVSCPPVVAFDDRLEEREEGLTALMGLGRAAIGTARPSDSSIAEEEDATGFSRESLDRTSIWTEAKSTKEVSSSSSSSA